MLPILNKKIENTLTIHIFAKEHHYQFELQIKSILKKNKMAKFALLKISVIAIISFIGLNLTLAAPQDGTSQFNFTPEFKNNTDGEKEQNVTLNERINWEGVVIGAKTITQGWTTLWSALQERGSFGDEDNNQANFTQTLE